LSDSPWQNPAAERMNRTLVEGARAMLFHKNVALRLWTAAILHMAYIRNRVYSTVTEDVPIRAFLQLTVIILTN
jgi:hypothetical protein